MVIHGCIPNSKSRHTELLINRLCIQANRIVNINAFEKKGCSPCLTHYSCTFFFLDQSTNVFFAFQTSNISDLNVEKCVCFIK